MPTMEKIKQVVFDYSSIIPVYITFFMVMTSVFNQDLKAFFWLLCVTLGVGIIKLIYERTATKAVIQTPNFTATPIIPDVSIFSNYPTCSVSAFFIMYTLVYLIMSMYHTQDWNYVVMFVFIGLYVFDVAFSKNTIPILGRAIGSFIGAGYGVACFFIARELNANKLLYFTVDASNRKYCSRAKKQQFKCFVYKGGKLVSTI
jgi:hypothetical protein